MVGQSQQSRRRGRRAAVLGFLKTVPGMLTALATMLTGVAGILAALTQVGVIQVRSPIVVGPATTTTVAQAPVLPAPTTSVEFPAAIDQTAPAPAPGGVVTTYLADLEPTQSSRLASTDEANINGKTFVHNVLFYACCDPASADYDRGRGAREAGQAEPRRHRRPPPAPGHQQHPGGLPGRLGGGQDPRPARRGAGDDRRRMIRASGGGAPGGRGRPDRWWGRVPSTSRRRAARRRCRDEAPPIGHA